MDTLPSEIILYIATFLKPHELVKLQLVCRRLLTIGRDDNLWRARCFERSSWESVRRRREPMFNIQSGSRTDANEKSRIIANWDPSYPGESVDWYAEFIYRTAPISVSWLQQPRNRENSDHGPVDVRGVGVYNCPGDVDSSIAFAPLDDGSVCLWDLSGSLGVKGRIVGRSDRGICCSPSSMAPDAIRAKMISTGITECISINNELKRAYIAVQSDLIEIDIETLKVISRESFPFSISAISEAKYSTPVTVGTNLSLHLYDSRVNQHYNPNSNEQLDFHRELDSSRGHQTNSKTRDPVPAISRSFASQSALSPQPINYAPLFHPGPLSIIHVPASGDSWDANSEIYVAGRFPSILYYNRRYFPKLYGTIYSGARLCSMTSIPCPFPDRMRRGDLSIAQVNDAKSLVGDTIIACGEYNSKGSLELYGLSPASLDLYGNRTQSSKSNFMRNRQTSSNSKLLSVSSHGTRIVFSDGDGNVKWVERDGFTEVRQWNIYNDALEPSNSRLERMFIDSGPGDIVRKIVRANADQRKRPPNSDDLVLWTGEKLGLLSFSSKPGFRADSFEEVVKSAEEKHQEREERAYRDTMGRALQRQADEVRFVGGLGIRRCDYL